MSMQYIKEDVEVMLKKHKENEAKLTEVELKIEEYQQELIYAGTVHEDTEEEVIENMQLAGQPFDSIYSDTHKTTDKVSSTAMNYYKEKRHVNNFDRTFLENKLRKLEEEKDYLNKLVVRVKNMMNPLTQDEKFVIRTYYMDKSKWDYVEKEYYKEFDKYKTSKQLQRYRDNAIESMLNIINIAE